MDKKSIVKIEDDIKKCELALKNNFGYENLFNELVGEYSTILSGFPTIENNSLYLRAHPEAYKNNIQIIYGFLKSFLKYEGRNNQMNNNNIPTININNNLNNENHINISSFAEAKDKIESMSALKEKEIDEILVKLSQLEEIVNSKDRKSKKWENAKEIIKWIADKGVDVGLTFLPLLLQIGQ